MLIKYTLLWVPLPFIFIANGLLRQFGYGPHMSDLAAHQISSLVGLVLLGVYVWCLNQFWPLPSGAQAVAVGVVWFLMTVLFEFVFGHFVAGHSWETLLRDYNLAAGRIWLLVLLWTALAPWVIHIIWK